MLNKLITSDGYDFDTPGTQIVPVSRVGVDSQFVKKAEHGVFHEFLSTLKPMPGKTIIHVLAVGDEEHYGPNRNCDGFSREDNVTAHRSFKDIGHVYRNHQSDDPLKAVGDVLATAHNALMSRIELMLALDNRKCPREVQAINSGQDVPVSMGSMQKFDVCSVCGHKAPTAADHCDHIKDMLGLVADDGRKIYMKNPNPRYFDISTVFKPADRIAYTLRKVAGGIDTTVVEVPHAWGTPKYALKRTLATLIKHVPAGIKNVVRPADLAPATVDTLKKCAELHGIEHLLAFLHANNWLLSPGDFGRVIGADPAAVEHGDSQTDMDDLLDDDQEIKTLQEPDSPVELPLSSDERHDLNEQCGMDDHARGRAIRITIIGQPKAASVVSPSLAQGLGLLYGQYKLAFGAHHASRSDILRTLAATW